MNKILSPEKLRELSVTERMELIEDVWASLSDRPEGVAVPDWHWELLDARITAHERNPGDAMPWDEVKSDILGKLSK